MAGRKQCSRDCTRPLTHGPPQQTPPFEIHDLAGILRTAAAENAAPRRVTDFGMLALLLKPDPSFLSYACSELVVADVVHIFTHLRDMNTLQGQKRLGRGWSRPSPSMATESRTSGTGERPVAVLTLIVSPTMFSPS